MDVTKKKMRAESLQSLEATQALISDAREDLREEYQAIEDARTAYDKALLKSRKEGSTPPSMEGVELRSLNELQTALETQRTNLEMNHAANPGVVEQYEKRKRDVGTCGIPYCHHRLC